MKARLSWLYGYELAGSQISQPSFQPNIRIWTVHNQQFSQEIPWFMLIIIVVLFIRVRLLNAKFQYNNYERKTIHSLDAPKKQRTLFEHFTCSLRALRFFVCLKCVAYSAESFYYFHTFHTNKACFSLQICESASLDSIDWLVSMGIENWTKN